MEGCSNTNHNKHLNLLGNKVFRNDHEIFLPESATNNFKIGNNHNKEKIYLMEAQLTQKMNEAFGYDVCSKLNELTDSSTIDALDIQINEYKMADFIHQNICSKNTVNTSFDEYLKFSPAKSFNFQLDNFQKRAILCMENKQSVLVAAHTSSGKTVIAEYAIAMCCRKPQKKVIFTSPIKALSNQKYSDFKKEFDDVGLLTGDVTINPTANCLVMTTEILRNMLYDKSKIVDEIGWVIFDEIHYLKDKTRGVVWEETIILLPSFIKFVFLSATIPNAKEFATWINQLKNEPINIILTEKRPVPVAYSVYFPPLSGVTNLVDLNGNFNRSNWSLLENAKKVKNYNNNFGYKSSFNSYATNKSYSPYDKKSYGEQKKNEKIQEVNQLVNLLIGNNNTPAIFFCFYKKECDDFAKSYLNGYQSFLNHQEENNVEKLINIYFNNINNNHQKLEQVSNMIKLLKKGIAYHHSGLMPIVRECIEMLFQMGYIKIIFATETLAIGINMPTKTVVFTRMYKYDGIKRSLNNSEFIQMSGRSGRRGLDTQGLSIMMLDNNEKKTLEVYNNLLNAKSENLFSSFRLRYSQILKILKTENSTIQYIGKKSFYQFQVKKGAPLKKTEIAKTFSKYKSIIIPELSAEEDEILKLEDNKEEILEKMQIIIMSKRNSTWAQHFEPGRILRLDELQYGILIGIKVNNPASKKKSKSSNFNKILIEENVENIILEVFICKKRNKLDMDLDSDRNRNQNSISYEIKEIPLENLREINLLQVKIPKNPAGKNFLATCEKKFNEIKDLLEQEQNVLSDPESNFGIIDKDLKKYYFDLLDVNLKLSEKRRKITKFVSDIIILKKNKKILEDQLYSDFKQLEILEEFGLKDDVDKMEKVLKDLSFIKEDKISAKGLFASEISAENEIILTEMIFNGVFDNLEPNCIVALLSCLIKEYGRFTKDDSYSRQNYLSNYLFIDAFKTLQDNFLRISSKISEYRSISFQEEFKTHFMRPTFDWANGVSFKEICENSEIYEGNLISCIKRIDELINQMIEGCRLIGNVTLLEKFQIASSLINKDIVSEKSLWLS